MSRRPVSTGCSRVRGGSHASPGWGGRPQRRLARGSRCVMLGIAGDGTSGGTCSGCHLPCQPCSFRTRHLPGERRTTSLSRWAVDLQLGWWGLPSRQPVEAMRTPCLPNTPEASWKNSGKLYKSGSGSSQGNPCDCGLLPGWCASEHTTFPKHSHENQCLLSAHSQPGVFLSTSHALTPLDLQLPVKQTPSDR